jgi:minor extracellular serine protease Vpr
MKRRLLMAAGMSTLLLATMVPGASMARNPERFGSVPIGGRKAHIDRLPSQQAKNRIVDVAVELEGRPVAVYQGAALASGKELSAGRTADLRNVLQRRQAGVRTQLRSLGADIEFVYTDVFNGFRIRVRANKLDEIAALRGVKAIYPVPVHTRANSNTVPYLGADKTWSQTGFTGKGVKIAIIDSGINYYHYDFGGAGFDAWKADDGLTRGGDFPTAKVVDGWDLVGDAYNANDANPILAPDPDPLDCKSADAGTVQHGTHVAGTAAGFGVTGDGKTYKGAYTPAAVEAADLRIWPGVAPEAKLMAFRVFGCDGSTMVTTDAIEMAVRAGADVINMSLGSTFGNPGSLDALASDNASLAGTTVVVSSGNEGSSAYVTGSPGSASNAITVAAMDAQQGFPGARIAMATGPDIKAINANDAPLPVTGKVRYFTDDPSTSGDSDTGEGFEQTGCTASAYAYNGFQAGEIAAVQRGSCARIAKAQEGQKHDAAAVVQINNGTGFPPFENVIAGVTIPFLGVSSADDQRFADDNGKSITATSAGAIGNDTYQSMAEFSSAGPGRVQNLIKPDITAPGVSVFSADGSTVAQGKNLGGTSMAAPAIAGVVALVKQAHPTWIPKTIKAAILGTAASGKVKPYEVRTSGAGLAQPRRAVDTKAFVYAEPGASSVTFGYQPAGPVAGTNISFTQSRTIVIVNTGSQAITYNLSNAFQGPSYGLNVSISPSKVTVPAKGRKPVTVTVSLSEANAGSLPDSAPSHAAPLAQDSVGDLFTSITTVAGVFKATPAGGGAGVYTLSVPWQVVPRGISRVQDMPGSRTAWKTSGDLRTSSIKVRNYGVHSGFADVYAWGLQDGNEGIEGIDLRAAGVQSVDSAVCDSSAKPTDRCLIFAVNLWGTFNNAGENEYDINIDLDNDGQADVALISIDLGLIFGIFYGVVGSVAIDLGSGSLLGVYFAGAGTNGSTILLPVLASDIGLKPDGDTGFEYWAESYEMYDDDGQVFQFDLMTTGAVAGEGNQLAQFEAFDPVLSTGTFKALAPNVTKSVPLVVDSARYEPTKRGQKGWMIVSLDDENGEFQANLVPVGADPS